MKGKTKRIIKNIGKKTFVISAIAVLSTTTVIGTMPTYIHANTQASEVTVDKARLQKKIKEYENFKSNHSSYSTFQNTLTSAQKALEDTTVTQDRVDYLTRNLEAHYYLVKVAELNSQYDYDTFDYSSYKTDTVISVIKMLGTTRYKTNVNYFENSENEGQMKGWYGEYQKAIEGLQKATAEDKYVGINPDSDKVDQRQGNFSIIHEEIVDGKTKITVRFDNDGLHPIYGESKDGKAFKKFSGTAMNDLRCRIEFFDENFKSIGSTGLDDYQYLDGKENYYNGFIGTVTLEESFAKATYISFKFSDDNDETFSPWYYSLDKKVEDGTIIISDNGNDETGTGTAESPVATLKKALELVEDGGTIGLASNITLDKTEITINKDVTIDGNGNSIIRPADQINAQTNVINVDKAEVSFENITLEAQALCKAVLNVKNGAVVTLGKDVIITGTTKNPAPIVMVDNATLNINGGSITKASGNGLKLVNNATVEFIEGSIIDNRLTGVLVTDGSTFTMNGGTISKNRTGVSHDAGSSSKVYLNAGVISGNTNELDVDLIADGNSYIELKKDVVQGNLNVLNRTQYLLLTKDYTDIRLGRGNDKKFDSYVEVIKDIDASIDIPNGLKNLFYWLQPSTSEVKLSVSKYDSVEDERIFVYYVPVTANGDVDTTRKIIVKENVALTDGYIDVSSDQLVKNTAYVLLVGNNQIDFSKLQTLVDEVDTYERNTGVHNNEFRPAFDKAEEILSKNNATQEEVDNAYNALDKAYARCQIQDYILDYYNRPYEKYADYTTDSALALYQTLGSAQNILDENTLTTDELKAYIKELDEKKAALVKVEEGTVKVEKGINKDAADNENNVGFFTVTEEANGDKVILHVEYHNDGINHLTNEELATLDFTNIKNYRIVIENRYYDKEENGSSSSTRNVNAEEFKPLNGETDYSKGFQFDYEVDPGNIKIRLKDLKQNEFIVYSLGTYLTDEEKNAPEALKIKKLDDGTVRVEFSEPVEIEDANWKKSDKAGERDGSVWIGTLTEDKFYEVAAKDLPGNSMTFTVDHKTPVVKSISYSETELTNIDVKVAINFDEYISVADTQLNPGWKYDVKHLKATKTFSENTTEDVTFVDKTGNKVTVTVTVNNIDKTVPEVEVSYSNDNGNKITKDDVTVTLTANEAIKDIEGWERTSDNTLTKVFSENGKYSVDVYDLAGNMTTVNFEVKRIDRIAPVITLHGVEPDGITKDKVTYTITEQSISKIVIDGVEYNEKNAPKEISGVGKHTIRVIDKAGNEASVSFTIVESVNPTVTVKDSSKGTEGHYSYLDLKLYDASGIDYVVVNGVEKDLTNNAWSDLNDVNVNYVEGHNVVEVYDIYGNKTVFEFDYDTVAPEVTVKDSSKGTDGYYSYLDLKLHDNKAIDYVVVNGVEKDLANNAWSDLNDVNVNYVEGHNVVEVFDIYGNKTVFEFDYDTTAPVIFAENITIKKGSTFDPLQGVKAIDNGKDITTSIVVEENNVNTRRTGKYEVRYSVTDLAGNTTEKTIIVTVEKKSCWENIVDIVEDTIKVVEDIVHGILYWIF